MLLYAFERGHKVTSYTTLVGMKIKDIEQFKHIPFEAFHIHLPDMQKYAKIAVNRLMLTHLRLVSYNQPWSITVYRSLFSSMIYYYYEDCFY